MSRSRVVASQPARASAASSLSLAAATVSRLLLPPAPPVIACMSAAALVSVSHVFPRSCSAHLQERGGPLSAVPRTGRAVGGHRGCRRTDARLARGSPGLGSDSTNTAKHPRFDWGFCQYASRTPTIPPTRDRSPLPGAVVSGVRASLARHARTERPPLRCQPRNRPDRAITLAPRRPGPQPPQMYQKGLAASAPEHSPPPTA